MAALQALAKPRIRERSEYESHAAWPLLMAALQQSIPLLYPRHLSGAVSACGILVIKPAWLPRLLARAEESMKTKPLSWNLIDISACLVGLAKLPYEGHPSIWATAQQHLPRLLPTAEARHISNCAWSSGKKQQSLANDVVDRLCVRFLEVLPQALSQEIANLLYGLA